MSHKVFANTREISSRSGSGKAACAFPDVCFTPPPPPGLPIPYPNTGVDSDTSNGSRSVRIARREAMLKNKSYFKTSTGDEAGCAPKKGVITSRIKGKVYFNAWSMDVKVEGENVVRHMDLTTHNHGSFPGNTTTWPYLSNQSPKKDETCGEEHDRQKTACQGVDDPCGCVGEDSKPSRSGQSREAHDLGDKTAANKCLAARRCMLQRYIPSGCCPPQTPHHLIEASALHDQGRGKNKKHKKTGETIVSTPLEGISGYDEHKAPCVCAEGQTQNTGTHGLMHTLQSQHATTCPEGTLPLTGGDETKTVRVTTYAAARNNSIEAFQTTFPHSNCGTECLKAQLDNYHNQCGVNDNTRIKAVKEGSPDVSAAQAEIQARDARVVQMLAEQEAGGAASAAAL
jgi:hypothetical protein